MIKIVLIYRFINDFLMFLLISLRKWKFHNSCFLSTNLPPLLSAFSLSPVTAAEPYTLSAEASSPLLDPSSSHLLKHMTPAIVPSLSYTVNFFLLC